MVVACMGDVETLPPPDFDAHAGHSAASGSAGSHVSGGSSGAGAASMPGTGGAGASSGSGGTGGASMLGGAGGSMNAAGTGGTQSATGGASGSGGTFMAAGMGGAGGSTGGKAGSGATGAGAGSGGRGGTGFGAGGRGGAGMAGNMSTGGTMAGGGGSAGSSTVAFSAVAAIIQENCADADCHGGKERPSLSSSNPSTLFTTLTNTTVRQCGSDRLVTAKDTANSALLELIQRQCGTFVMPEGCKTTPCLTADEMATITAWIQAGAPGP